MNYAQQIKHPLWQKKRLEVLEASGFECENCGDKEETLHVHHPFYRRGAMIWEYEKSELECLCNKCHKSAHALDEKIRLSLSKCSITDKEKVMGYISALNADFYKDDAPNIDLASYESIEGAFDAYAADLVLDSKSRFVDLLVSNINGVTDFRSFKNAVILSKWKL